MTTPTVTVYVAGHGCKPCAATKRRMDKLQIPYTTAQITGDIAKWAAEQWPGQQVSAPIVVPADGDAWFGHRPDRIDELVASDG